MRQVICWDRGRLARNEREARNGLASGTGTRSGAALLFTTYDSLFTCKLKAVVTRIQFLCATSVFSVPRW